MNEFLRSHEESIKKKLDASEPVWFHSWKPRVRFNDIDCEVGLYKYGDGRKKLDITERGTLRLITIATADMPEVEIGQFDVIIKNFDENKGILKALIKGSVVFPPHSSVKKEGERDNFYLPICRLRLS